MKRCFAFAFILFVSPAAFAQTPEVIEKVEAKLATIRFVNALYDPATGGFKGTPDGKPSLRACNAAAKVLAIHGQQLPDRDKTAAFVLACYDPKPGRSPNRVESRTWRVPASASSWPWNWGFRKRSSRR